MQGLVMLSVLVAVIVIVSLIAWKQPDTFGQLVVLLLIGVAVGVGIPAIGIAIGSGWTVSEGERVGVVQKVSERGAFISTTEVEVALLGEGTGKQVARVWEASLDRSAAPAGVRDALEAALKDGASVRIRYREVMVHAPWRMETDYAILSVERTK